MELTLGMAFRCMMPPRHIFVPVFDEQSDSDEILLVNFTTLRQSCVDDTCILNSADYCELTHETTVAYSKSMIGKKSAFLAAVAKGGFIQLEDLPAETWQKIISGAHRSDQLSAVKKRLLPPVT